MKIIGVYLILICICGQTLAQDLVITNARIITGSGEVIETGSIAIKDQRIVSVQSGDTETGNARILDARGMTVMPGLIDTHRHLRIAPRATNSEEMERWIAAEMPAILAATLAHGLTTIVSNGDPYPYVLDIRNRINNGDLAGPRILTAGPLLTAPGGHPAGTFLRDSPFHQSVVAVEIDDPELARETVRKLAAAGVDQIKAVYSTWPPAPRMNDDVLAAIADEAVSQGLNLDVHTASIAETLRAAELGAKRFVHTPHLESISGTPVAALLRNGGLPMSTTVSPWSPEVFAIRGEEYPAARRVRHKLRLDNVRKLWDDGVLLAFGSDNPAVFGDAAFVHEATILSRALSNEEIITALTLNAAIYLGLDDKIGTLAPGKLADIVIVDGDPLADISELANIVVVIKGGDIVADKR
jgi:imidazolonepropionase-like amidohydrolase